MTYPLMQTEKLIEKRQQAYLEAMDIPVWVARQQPDTEVYTDPSPTPVPRQPQPQSAVIQTLKLGPGSGGVLLICAKDTESSSKLATDIARALPKNPVWGWPDNDDSAVTPADAVEENLFTVVAVFGEALAQLLFGQQVPDTLGSARLVVLPAMSELHGSADARRQLWSIFCRSGMVVA